MSPGTQDGNYGFDLQHAHHEKLLLKEVENVRSVFWETASLELVQAEHWELMSASPSLEKGMKKGEGESSGFPVDAPLLSDFIRELWS